MAAMFAWPSQLKVTSSGLAITFVLPATCCNLSCSYCAIKQRQETKDSKLSLDDYVYFAEDVIKHYGTAIMAIQGYEPLLPESWPYTVALLELGRRLGVPTSLVTNGYFLSDRHQEIANLAPAGITVSVDSSVAVEHDKLRGKSGAFDAAIKGVQNLASISDFSEKITVASVLFPRKRHLLEGMPRLLSNLGLKHWAVSPVFQMGKLGLGGPVAPPRQIVKDLHVLNSIAADLGIFLVFDDELRTLPAEHFAYSELIVRRFERPDGLIRLAPSGACSAGADILKSVDCDTPIWDRTILPHKFVQRLVPRGFNEEPWKRAA
jgi:pyruvate-formate lyase-activating enzyme